ncbi:MAG TPA: FAD-dependent oxidoreductase [Steroidobacteraceae bacterium]|nr:FAD-dependent oxidoreductase [Steroidobacteraceae bacterium]
MRISVIGAGVAGLSCALELSARGASVEVLERSPAPPRNCSWFAGGMLAPWCEQENSGPLIARLGAEALPWWQEHFPGTLRRGTLLLAHARDRAELRQFARRTEAFNEVDANGIAALEPELAGRFDAGLYFPAEGHLDPRAALSALSARLGERGVPVLYDVDAGRRQLAGRAVLDCSGLAARAQLPQLRGVKGEMLLLRLPELRLTRPVRLLHPRLPVYLVPREAGVYLVGASMIESDAGAHVSARSLLELLSAAYALHPAFGEADVLELGAAVRPAFPDNLPRLQWCGTRLHVNGLYRHGFLLAPALARRAALTLLEGHSFPEVMHEDSGERRVARGAGAAAGAGA